MFLQQPPARTLQPRCHLLPLPGPAANAGANVSPAKRGKLPASLQRKYCVMNRHDAGERLREQVPPAVGEVSTD